MPPSQSHHFSRVTHLYLRHVRYVCSTEELFVMDKWSDLFPDGIVSPLWCLGFWCRCSYWSKNTLKSQLACRIREPERSYKKDLSYKSQAESEQENQQQEDWGPAGGEQQNVEWWRNKQSSVSRMQSGRSYSPNSRGKKSVLSERWEGDEGE